MKSENRILSEYIESKKLDGCTKEKIIKMFHGVLSGGENDINLELADVKMIFDHDGEVFIGSAECKGENSAKEAIELSIKDANLTHKSLGNIEGVMIYFTMHPDYTLVKLAHAVDIINENAHDDADIIWGTFSDDRMRRGIIRVSGLFVTSINKIF